MLKRATSYFWTLVSNPLGVQSAVPTHNYIIPYHPCLYLTDSCPVFFFFFLPFLPCFSSTNQPVSPMPNGHRTLYQILHGIFPEEKTEARPTLTIAEHPNPVLAEAAAAVFTANLLPHAAMMEHQQPYLDSFEQKHSEDATNVRTVPMPLPPQVYPLAQWPGFVLEEQMEQGDDPVWTNLATGASHFGQGPTTGYPSTSEAL
jgi:hypothetical protein